MNINIEKNKLEIYTTCSKIYIKLHTKKSNVK